MRQIFFARGKMLHCLQEGSGRKKLKKDKAYLNRLIDANVEDYRIIKSAGHKILPKSDEDFESARYRKTCFIFFRLMCATALGKICVCDHAMNAADEMSALNRDIKGFYDKTMQNIPYGRSLKEKAENI